MFGYSGVLLVVGSCWSFHLAQDSWVYAKLFIALNLLKIDYSNCNTQVPKVRGNLSRVITSGVELIV